MSGAASRGPSEGCKGPVQGPCRASYRWHHYRKPWWRSDPQPEQLLGRYKWRTSARLAPGAANTSPPQVKGQSVRPLHLRLVSLPGFGSVMRPGSLRGTLPFLRSVSEPGTGDSPERTVLRKAGSAADRRAPVVSSFIRSFSPRIGIRDDPETDGGESGRRA